jgi:hypothetical protein
MVQIDDDVTDKMTMTMTCKQTKHKDTLTLTHVRRGKYDFLEGVCRLRSLFTVLVKGDCALVKCKERYGGGGVQYALVPIVKGIVVTDC